MFTYCPNCAAVFRVSAAQLTYADGAVRCGECRAAYQATEFLFDDMDSLRAALETQTDPAPVEAVQTPLDYVAAATGDTDRALADEIPASIRPPDSGWEQPRVVRGDWLRGGGIIALVLLLGVQWAWFNRVALAADDTWRPGIERFCAVMQCSLPMPRDLASLAVVRRDVRQHPTVEQALLINAVFENDAAFAQAYPVFEISFTDQTGKPVAVRRFREHEYLRSDVDPSAGIQPGEQVQVVIEVLDPGKEAVSFQFGFL